MPISFEPDGSISFHVVVGIGSERSGEADLLELIIGPEHISGQCCVDRSARMIGRLAEGVDVFRWHAPPPRHRYEPHREYAGHLPQRADGWLDPQARIEVWQAAKVKYAEKQPALEAVFFAIVGDDGQDDAGNDRNVGTTSKEQ